MKMNNTSLQLTVPFEGDEKLKIKNINSYAFVTFRFSFANGLLNGKVTAIRGSNL